MSEPKYLHTGEHKYELETLPDEIKQQLSLLNYARQEQGKLEAKLAIQNISVQAIENSIAAALESVEPAAD